ncbi:hypothetical protein E5359_020195 [Bacteroidales bacterium]|jgi:phage-related minor tail protein|uniref:hypothetical protein n=2 Tax=Bacteroidales TaxID=171549 RepID=UPI001094E5F7|nr:hypothetical protein [Paramuribaculum intestinale]TKC54072.1 hypothetical protein E5359_020195 [Bacteroidales bacterium]
MSFSEILNILLGTGLMGLVVAVATMKATVRKANADAEKAKADAETVRITNTENATRILVENIVKPLKEELNATRTDLQATKKEMASTKREMARLRKAVEAASGCRHADYCPVLFKLRDNQKDTDAAGADLLDFREERHNCGSDQADSHAAGPGEPGEPGSIRGQPP